MNTKLIGGILLVVGTSIGGGMLALPIATAQGGFLGAILLLFGAWIAMTFGAFLILEVNLWFPQGSNLVSMAKHTLGRSGEAVAWVTYLLLLYCLLAAYIAGGSDIFKYLLSLCNIHLPNWLASLIFVLVLGAIVCLGIKFIDIVNRGLMFIKLVAFILLFFFITPHIQVQRLTGFYSQYLVSAITVVITSFGFATIVPSLRSYFKGDIKKLRQVILIGSLIPLFCYIAWEAAIIGEIPLAGQYGLLEIIKSGHTTAALTQSLIIFLHNPGVVTIASTFTSICVFTSFLGVSLCLSDFLADGFNKTKTGFSQLWIYAATFFPPFALVILNPNLFIVGLSYAGIFCAILLVFLPALMAWRGRYHLQIESQYQVWGGKFMLILVSVVALLIIFHEILIDLRWL